MAATYADGIPALAPLVSGVNDNAAATINVGQNMDGTHVTAAMHQHANRKRLAMLNPPLATPAEVVSSKRRKHKVQSANFDGPIPAWAHQMQQTMTQVQQTQTQMQQTMTRLEQTQTQMQQTLTQVQQTQTQMRQTQTQMQHQTRQLVEDNQRSKNRSRRNDTDRIQPLIRLADGQLPVAPHLNNGVVFPANQIVLQAMTEAEIDVLLTFYALPTGGTVNAKLIRLMQHLGMTL
jgi:hypothetical protein